MKQDQITRIVGGPIEMRDYSHIRLAVDHDAVLPDGSTVRLPLGTLLLMLKSGGNGIEQDGGSMNKNMAAVDPRDGVS